MAPVERFGRTVRRAVLLAAAVACVVPVVVDGGETYQSITANLAKLRDKAVTVDCATLREVKAEGLGELRVFVAMTWDAKAGASGGLLLVVTDKRYGDRLTERLGPTINDVRAGSRVEEVEGVVRVLAPERPPGLPYLDVRGTRVDLTDTEKGKIRELLTVNARPPPAP